MVSVALAAALALNPLSPLAPYGGVTAEAAAGGWTDNGIFQTSLPTEFNAAKLLNKQSEQRLREEGREYLYYSKYSVGGNMKMTQGNNLTIRENSGNKGTIESMYISGRGADAGDWSAVFSDPKFDDSWITEDVQIAYRFMSYAGTTKGGFVSVNPGTGQTVMFDNPMGEWLITDWAPYLGSGMKGKGLNAVFSGSEKADVRSGNVLLADLTSPGEDGWDYSVTNEPAAGAPVLWLQTDDTLRTAYGTYTRSTRTSMNNMKLTLGIVPKDNPTAEPISVTAQAEGISADGHRLGFQVLENDWKNYEGGEYQIITVTDATDYEGQWYTVYASGGLSQYGQHTNTGADVIATDLAGNGVYLKGLNQKNVRSYNLMLDMKAPEISRVKISGSAVDSTATTASPDQWPADIDRSALFSTAGDTVQFRLQLSERVVWPSADDMEKIVLSTNLTDSAGDPVTAVLSEIEDGNADGSNGNVVSTLVFEPITITADMKPQGGQIRPASVSGTDLLADYSGNGMEGQADLSDIAPDIQNYLDTQGPTATLSQILTGSKTDAEANYTILFKVSDGESGSLFAGTAGAEGKLALTSYANAPQMSYAYEVTRDANAPQELTKSGTVGGEGNAVWSTFQMTGEGTYYLHLKLTGIKGKELLDSEPLKMELLLTDVIGNQAESVLPVSGLRIDSVAPELTVVPAETRVERDGSTNKVTFSAQVSSSDRNGLDRLEYQWVESGQTPAENGWTVINYQNNSSGEKKETLSSDAVNGTATVSRDLYVRVYDKYENETEKHISMSANPERAVSRYEVLGNPDQPSNETDILISVPTSTGGDSSTGQPSTRATVVMGNNTYVRVISSGEKVSLLDQKATDWYRVTVSDDGRYSSVESGASPDWNYYGEMQVSLYSSLEKNLIPRNGELIEDTTDTTGSQDAVLTLKYASEKTGVYNVSFEGATDASGNALEPLSTSTPIAGSVNPKWHHYYKLDQGMTGTRYPFSLSTKIMPGWGLADLDFDRSYAVLVALDNTGNVQKEESGQDREVSAQAALSKGGSQVFSVPAADKNGNAFATGAYAVKVHIVQKEGGEQDFYTTTQILLDASGIPSRFGVLSYSAAVDTTNRYGTDSLQWSREASEGQVLGSVSIGVARPGREGMASDTKSEAQEAGGHAAYVLETQNSLNSLDSRNHSFSFNLTAEMDAEDQENWLGCETGEVVGIRYWNAASSGDPSGIAYSTRLNRTESDGKITYRTTVTGNYNWYGNGSTVVSAEELAKCNVNDFKVALGSNTVCYQLVMENGVTSPVYQVQLNLLTQAPDMELEYDCGPGVLEKTLLESGETVYKRHAEYIDVTVKSVFSPNGNVKIYHAKYDKDAKKWTYTEKNADEAIRLTTSGDGYYGSDSTNQNLSSGNAVSEFICAVDGAGNAACAYPITMEGANNTEDAYYYTIDGYSLKIEDPVNKDGAYQIDLKLNFWIDLANIADSVTLQVDDRTPMTFGSLEEWFDGREIPANTAGVIGIEKAGYNWDGTDSREGSLRFVMPYNPAVAEGAQVDHTVTVTVKGNTDASYTGQNVTTKTFTITAPNTKPEVKLSDETPQPGKVSVTSNAYVREAGTAGNFAKQFDIGAYKDGAYALTVEDPYGQQYTSTLDIQGMPTDPEVTVSTKENTTEPVTVTAKSGNYNLYVNADKLPTGTKVSGNNSGNLVLTVPENGSFSIYYMDHNEQETDIPVTIGNIYNTEIVPRIIWNYEETEIVTGGGKIDEETGEMTDVETQTVVYGNAVATLVDENGSELTDPRTGEAPCFTFVPGGITEYTFSGYVNQYGIAGPDIMASLPVTLQPYPSGTEEDDAYRPDLALTGWMIRDDISTKVKAVYLNEDDNRPDGSSVGLSAYGEFGEYEPEDLLDSADTFLKKMGWADSYLFNVDIADETAVRLFVKAGETAAAPDYADGTSDEIEGVTLQGRMLQVDGNTDFTLFAVDENNNSTSVYLNITNLGGLPEPNYAQVLDKNGKVRIYLMPPNLEGVSGLQITNDDNNDKKPDAQIQEDETSLFYGYPYLTVEKNGSVRVYYSYAYEGYTNTGYIDMEVAEIDTNPPVAVEQTWSANYDPEGKTYTNQEISLQLQFDKHLKDAVLLYVNEDGEEEPVTSENVSVSWMENRVTIVYEDNVPKELRLRVWGVNNVAALVDIPAVTTIDKIAPEISAEISGYAPNHRSAEVTVTVNETGVILQETGETGAASGDNTVFTETVKENGTFTYTVADKAGNKNHTTVTVNDLVTEPLSLELSSGGSDSSIIDPETYQPSIGDTLYARTNRAADISVNGNTETKVSAAAGTWVRVTIAEDSEGLYPSVRAVDAYGNAAVVQLLRIPMGDRTAPVVLTVNSLISASRDTTEEELGKLFRSNLICSDDTTAADQLMMEFAYDRSSGASKVPVSYTVKDAAGNSAKGTFWLRLYGGDELRVTVNGQDVTWDETVLLDSREPEIIVYSNGERYKVDMKAGIKTAAQLKTGAVRVSGYTDREENELKVTLDESGYYTFCITTQGRTIYRFVLYVED